MCWFILLCDNWIFTVRTQNFSLSLQTQHGATNREKKLVAEAAVKQKKNNKKEMIKGKRSLNPGNSREKMRDLVEGMVGEEKFQWHSRKILELEEVIFLASRVSRDQR